MKKRSATAKNMMLTAKRESPLAGAGVGSELLIGRLTAKAPPNVPVKCKFRLLLEFGGRKSSRRDTTRNRPRLRCRPRYGTILDSRSTDLEFSHSSFYYLPSRPRAPGHARGRCFSLPS